MAIRRVAGKPGKWVAVSKGIPDGTYPCLVYLSFPNRQRCIALAKLSFDSFVFEYFTPPIEGLDLSAPGEQENLNRYAKSWQKIEVPDD